MLRNVVPTSMQSLVGKGRDADPPVGQGRKTGIRGCGTAHQPKGYASQVYAQRNCDWLR